MCIDKDAVRMRESSGLKISCSKGYFLLRGYLRVLGCYCNIVRGLAPSTDGTDQH